LGLSEAAFRGVAFLLIVATCAFAARWILNNAHAFGSQWRAPEKTQAFQFAGATPTYGIQQRNRRLVYPYSVIPGGVRSADELREIAKHDPVVAQHYSGFDYARAHIIALDRPKLVYVSYRRGGHIHWTSKQATLRAGEKLLTDGRITARTRCGNQVSVLPEANTLADEPQMAELERPDAVASGMENLFPQSANALQLDPLLPIGPPYAGFPELGSFMPWPIAPGVPKPGGCVEKKKGTNSSDTKKDDCNHKPHHPPPPTVPEPGSFVLMLSGAAALYARVRMRRA
jgi:hypothetical protein